MTSLSPYILVGAGVVALAAGLAIYGNASNMFVATTTQQSASVLASPTATASSSPTSTPLVSATPTQTTTTSAATLVTEALQGTDSLSGNDASLDTDFADADLSAAALGL